jgi:hypothetical protein
MRLLTLSATDYLSIFGIIILLISIALIFSGRATSLKAPQRIRGFGVELEISVLTLLVLVGLTLSLSSIYMQVSGYQQQLSSSQQKLNLLSSDISSAQRQLEAAKKIDMTVYITLDGVSSPRDMPKLGDLVSRYYVHGQGEQPVSADVSRGAGSTSISLSLKNLTPETHIDRLEVVDQKFQRVWVKTNFYPLNPTYDLGREASDQ